MKKYQLYATMGAGFESVVNKELQSMGYKTKVENGRVFFEGTQEDIVKVNLWSRTADRIKILLKEFKATDFSTLFDEVYAYDWAELLPVDAKFPVQGRAVKSKLHSEPDVQSIVKKAIVNKMHFNNIRIFMVGTNLLTWSSFKTWDPEMGDSRGESYPLTKSVTLGISVNL